MFKAIALFILTYFSCSFINNYWLRNRSKNVIRNFKGKSKKIALTFDDGPDVRYTGQILDLLKKYQIKATFFIVAEKVRKYPYIIERMREDGHTIAMHSLNHKNAWFSLPWETYKEFKITKEIFRGMKLTVNYYRPPWGQFNLFNYYFAAKNNMQTVLWSAEVNDWEKNKSPEDIFIALKSKFKANDIILLHDSGGDVGAPQHTIEALKLFIPYCKNEGFRFVTINEGII